MSVLYIVIAISLVIFFHEFGHFIFAKKFGVTVERFSIGFGPKIFEFPYKGTIFRISLFPIGGYVKMKGENYGEEKGEPDEFLSQKWYKKILIVFFGPFFNYFLSFLIFFSLVIFYGIPQPKKGTIVGELLPNKPAVSSGLKKGDKILKVDKTKVNTWKELSVIIHNSGGRELILKIERNGKVFDLKITPQYDKEMKVSLIGILPEVTYTRGNIFLSLYNSFRITISYTERFLRGLFEIITGKRKPEVAGPVGIIGLLNKAAHQGFDPFLNLLAIISLNLALINLFPIPLLDGSYILFFFIEGITRKKLSQKSVEIAQMIGLSILLFLFLYATQQDIMRIFLK